MSHLIETEIVGLAGKKTPTHITFDRHVNVIFGLNGTGKTSLLKILHSAMTGDATSLSDVPFKSATVRIYSITEDKIFTRHLKQPPSLKKAIATSETESPRFWQYVSVRGDMVTANPPDTRVNWEEIPRRGDRPELTRWAHQYLPTTRLHVGAGRLFDSGPNTTYGALTEELLDEFFAQSLRRLWSDYSSDILQAVRSAQERGLASILKAVLTAAEPKLPTKSVVALEDAYQSVKSFLERQGSASALGEFKYFSKRYHTDRSLQRVVQDIQHIEQEIASAMAPRRQLETLIKKLYSGNKTIDFQDRAIVVRDDDDNQIGLESLSSGEKHLLRLLVETLITQENTILIDEPEISMHIDWQRDLIATFRTLNSNAQFILATHSPEIMAEIPEERIFSL